MRIAIGLDSIPNNVEQHWKITRLCFAHKRKINYEDTARSRIYISAISVWLQDVRVSTVYGEQLIRLNWLNQESTTAQPHPLGAQSSIRNQSYFGR